MKKAVVLLSGGLDSATVLAIAKSQGYNCLCLSFSYGQKHNIELNKSKLLAAKYNCEHKIITLDPTAFQNSALTNSEITVPKSGLTSEIPATYVPARNTIFLSYALAFAETIGASDIFIGVNALDYSGYPDCRPEYISAYEKMANLATKVGVEGKKLTIQTPLINLTKAEIIMLGNSLDTDYFLTSSCYEPVGEKACGTCDSCRLRLKGFNEAGLKDPIDYV